MCVCVCVCVCVSSPMRNPTEMLQFHEKIPTSKLRGRQHRLGRVICSKSIQKALIIRIFKELPQKEKGQEKRNKEK